MEALASQKISKKANQGLKHEILSKLDRIYYYSGHIPGPHEELPVGRAARLCRAFEKASIRMPYTDLKGSSASRSALPTFRKGSLSGAAPRGNVSDIQLRFRLVRVGVLGNNLL
jgi:hypothetical protein